MPSSVKANFELGNHTIGKIGLCASLYNPFARKEILTYPKYYYQTEHGGMAFPISLTEYCGEKYNTSGISYYENKVWSFWNRSDFFLYRKIGEDEYSKDNWFIRYV